MINHIRYRVVKRVHGSPLEPIEEDKPAADKPEKKPAKKKTKSAEPQTRRALFKDFKLPQFRTSIKYVLFGVAAMLLIFVVFTSFVFLRHRQLCGYQGFIDQGWIQQSEGGSILCPNILDTDSLGIAIANAFNFGINSQLSPADTDTLVQDNPDSCNDPLDPICWVSGSAPDLDSTNGFTNFLLVGVDSRRSGSGSGLRNTDSIILASLEKSTGKMMFISFPRDLYVYYQRPNGVRTSYKINGVYAIDGVEGLKGVVEQITAREIHYYAFIDLGIFEDVINTLGGVEIELDEPFADRFPCAEIPQGETCPRPVWYFDGQFGLFEFPEGKNTFDAFDAMVYARSRKISSDFDRAERQQNLIKAIIRQVLEDDSPLTEKVSLYLDLYRLFEERVESNIEIEDVAAVFTLAEKLDSAAVSLVVDNNLGNFTLVETLGILENVGWSIGFIDITHQQFQRYVDNIWNNLSYYIEEPKVLFVNQSGKPLTEQELAPIVQNNNYITYEIRATDSTSPITKLYDLTNGEKVGTLYDLQSKLEGSLVFDPEIDGIAKSDYGEDILVVIGE